MPVPGIVQLTNQVFQKLIYIDIIWNEENPKTPLKNSVVSLGDMEF